MSSENELNTKSDGKNNPDPPQISESFLDHRSKEKKVTFSILPLNKADSPMFVELDNEIQAFENENSDSRSVNISFNGSAVRLSSGSNSSTFKNNNKPSRWHFASRKDFVPSNAKIAPSKNPQNNEDIENQMTLTPMSFSTEQDRTQPNNNNFHPTNTMEELDNLDNLGSNFEFETISPFELDTTTLSGMRHFISSQKYIIEKDQAGKVLRVIDKRSGSILDCKPRLKIEVIRADSISYVFNTSYFLYAFSMSLVLLLTILVNTKFLTTEYFFEYGCDDGTIVRQCQLSDQAEDIPGCSTINTYYPLRNYELPRSLEWFNIVAQYLYFIYSIYLVINYLFHFAQVDSSMHMHEQYLSIFLVCTVCAFMIPYTVTTQLIRFTTDRQPNPNGYLAAGIVFQSLFTFISLFYVWIGAHFYRFLAGKADWKFYTFKVLAVLGYVAVIVISSQVIDFEFGYPPPATLVNTIIFFVNIQYRTDILICSIILIIYEIFLITAISRAFIKTKRLLDQKSFLEYRSRQVGFRVFSYHNILHYSCFITSSVLMQIFYPQAQDQCKYLITGVFVNSISIGWIPLLLMILTYTTFQSYFFLPSSSLGFIDWCKKKSYERKRHLRKERGEATDSDLGSDSDPEHPHENNPQEFRATTTPQMITYKKKEPTPMIYDASTPTGSCFVMQTHVKLFNFAWLSYSYYKKKLPFDLNEFMNSDEIVEIHDPLSDTRVVIVGLDDRIVVAFKGTTSMQNIGTDIKFHYTKLEEVVPLSHERYNELELLWPYWRYGFAKIHKGFAEAYTSVSNEVKEAIHIMYAFDRRPVFFTGHSLGGALATICSLDAVLNYEFLRNLNREVFVSTFGSPRVGNRTSAMIYDSLVPMNWRVIIQTDIIPEVPKFGYKHVGRKILFTIRGLLVLDPNAIEGKLWHGHASNFTWHKKSYYLWGMKMWCNNQHGDSYVPEFWPWKLEFDPTNDINFENVLPESSSFRSLKGIDSSHTNENVSTEDENENEHDLSDINVDTTNEQELADVVDVDTTNEQDLADDVDVDTYN